MERARSADVISTLQTEFSAADPEMIRREVLAFLASLQERRALEYNDSYELCTTRLDRRSHSSLPVALRLLLQSARDAAPLRRADHRGMASRLRRSAAMGVLQLHLTGGEPLARPDTEQLVKAGRAAGLYVNLITSGVGLAEARLDALIDAGLDHIQLSFQDSEQPRSR